MTPSSFGLLLRRRFLWLFVTQFAGAANDNLFKNAMAILIVYRLGGAWGLSPPVLVSLAAGAFILPFFLFSATAGLIADAREKSRLVRLIKFVELPVSAFASFALFRDDPGMLMAALFLFGVQASFFGPVKYAILPELLGTDEIVAGNALVEGGTFLAILLGTIGGGLLILLPGGEAVVSILMGALAVLGLFAALAIPRLGPGEGGRVVLGGLVADTLHALSGVRAEPRLRLAILGISWFWFVGATFLAQFPAFAKDTLRADQQVVTLMLTMFSLGIGAGSMLCARLLKGGLSTRPVPWGALGIALFSFDLAFFPGPVGGAGAFADATAFLAAPAGWRVLADLVLISVCGGLFIVPLYTTLQMASERRARARAVAANNIVNAAFMVGSAVSGAAMLAAGAGVGGVFLAVGAATLPVGLVLRRLSR